MYEKLIKAKLEIEELLKNKIIPFWLNNSIDNEFGGYITNLDSNGKTFGNFDKFIVIQSRMLWGFSNLHCFANKSDKLKMEKAARQGFEFIVNNFWDNKHGGFAWQTNRKGEVLDYGKLVYGQSFAIYALSEYYLCFNDSTALEYAEKTFDLLQIYAADTSNGGYFENLEANFEVSKGGVYAGDRKSLDIHMHLMEAFTTLYKASKKEVHKRKLLEVVDLIMTKMVNNEIGYGYNQFNSKFERIPAINIYRTWNFERETNEIIEEPIDSTSYGHNVELTWLLDEALKALNLSTDKYKDTKINLLDYALKYGYDYEYGGIYRDGTTEGEVLVKDKEWWQNFEILIGFINAYSLYGKKEYVQAFLQSWDFVKNNFIHENFGESYQLLDRYGNKIIDNMGNDWKGIYHTGRALFESVNRINSIEKNQLID